MKQYHLEGKTLTLNIRKSPLFVRGIMFFFSFVSFALPLIAISLSLSMGNRFHIGYMIGLILFGLIGFYLLRISLWNTYGKEIIELDIPKISYEANYGWFIDGKKSINSKIINYGIKPIGYVEEKKGVLTIVNDKTKIESVVKMPIRQIEELIKTLNKSS